MKKQQFALRVKDHTRIGLRKKSFGMMYYAFVFYAEKLKKTFVAHSNIFESI